MKFYIFFDKQILFYRNIDLRIKKNIKNMEKPDKTSKNQEKTQKWVLSGQKCRPL